MANLVKRSSVFSIFGLFSIISRRKRETSRCHKKSTAWNWEVVQPILESPWWVLSPKTYKSKMWDLTLDPPPTPLIPVMDFIPIFLNLSTVCIGRSHHQLLRYPHPEIKLINSRSHHQLLRYPHPEIKLINGRSHHQLLRHPHPEIKLINGRSHHQLLRHPHPEIKLTIAHCAQGENLMIFEYSTMYMIHF